MCIEKEVVEIAILLALMMKTRSMTRLTVDSLRLTGIRSKSCPRENNRLEAAVGLPRSNLATFLYPFSIKGIWQNQVDVRRQPPCLDELHSRVDLVADVRLPHSPAQKGLGREHHYRSWPKLIIKIYLTL